MRHTAVACALLVVCVSASAQEKLDANARFCDEFARVVITGGDIGAAPKYVTSDFKEHNVRLATTGLSEFATKLNALRAAITANGGRGGFGARPAGAPAPERTVLSHGDLVVFITLLPERDNPASPGQRLPRGSHFDVYQLRDGKIAEHWD